MNEPVPKTRQISSKSLIGSIVNNDQGEVLGRIDEVLINWENGTVSNLIMSSDDVMQKQIAVPWDLLQIDDETQALNIRVDSDFLDRIPAYQGDL
jgi:sporulation protein YlmC with PRC-barrel domain